MSDSVIPQKVREAIDTINEYRQEINKAIGKSEYTCICCKKNKIKLFDSIRMDIFKQEQQMWDNGTVEKVTFGYGSMLDLESFYVGICDNCTQEAYEQGVIVSFRDLKKNFRQYTDNEYSKEIFKL